MKPEKSPDSKPSIFNFKNGGSINPKFKVVRGTIGSYFGSDGKLKIAKPNQPRITYDPATGECLGLLVETARSNEYRNSKNLLDTANWFATNVNITAVADERWGDVFRITPSFVNSEYPLLRCNFNTIPVNQKSTMSIRVKSLGAEGIRLQRNAYDNNYARVEFSFIQKRIKAIVASGLAVIDSYGFVDEGDGWYRIWMTSIAKSDSALINQMVSYSAVYSTDGPTANDTFLIAHPQHEIGAGMTSYIETTGSSVTRAGESIHIDLPAAVKYPVTMVAQWYTTGEYSRRPFNLLSSTNTDIISFFSNTSRAFGAGSATSIKNGVDLNVGEFFEKPVGTLSAAALCVDGVTFRSTSIFSDRVHSVAGDVLGSNMNIIAIGSNPSNLSASLNGVVRFAAIYNERVTDEQLFELARL